MQDKARHGTNPAGVRHGHAKLTEAQVSEIRLDDRTTTRIALDYGVSQSLVSMIKARKIWKHVP
jgi:hypothetical protein